MKSLLIITITLLMLVACGENEETTDNNIFHEEDYTSISNTLDQIQLNNAFQVLTDNDPHFSWADETLRLQNKLSAKDTTYNLLSYLLKQKSFPNQDDENNPCNYSLISNNQASVQCPCKGGNITYNFSFQQLGDLQPFPINGNIEDSKHYGNALYTQILPSCSNLQGNLAVGTALALYMQDASWFQDNPIPEDATIADLKAWFASITNLSIVFEIMFNGSLHTNTHTITYNYTDIYFELTEEKIQVFGNYILQCSTEGCFNDGLNAFLKALFQTSGTVTIDKRTYTTNAIVNKILQ